MIVQDQLTAQRVHEVLAELDNLGDSQREEFINSLEDLGLRIADVYFGFTHAISLLHRDAASKNSAKRGSFILLKELARWLLPEAEYNSVQGSNDKVRADGYAKALTDAAGDGSPSTHEKFWKISDRSLSFVELLKSFS
jgi:hypothetical protein